MKKIYGLSLIVCFLLCGYVAAAQSGGYFRKPMKFDKAGKAEYKSYSVDQWLEHHLAFPANYTDTVSREFLVRYGVSPRGEIRFKIVPENEDDPLYQRIKETLTVDGWVPAMYRKLHVGVPFIDSLYVRFTHPAIEVRTDRTVRIHEFVEQMPEFPGGNKALSRFVGENLRYKSEWQRAGIGGSVLARFIITENGEVEDVTILRTPHPELAHEVMRVLSMSPLWKPGRQDGEPVAVRFIIPVRFQKLDTPPSRKP